MISRNSYGLTMVVVLALCLLDPQSSDARMNDSKGIAHRVASLEAELEVVNNLLDNLAARLEALEEGSPQEPRNECPLWTDADLQHFNNPWTEDLYLPTTPQILTIDTRVSEGGYFKLEVFWTIGYQTTDKNTGESWTVFNLLSVNKISETGVLTGRAFKQIRQEVDDEVLNERTDPEFDVEMVLSNGEFVACAETLYGEILPNGDVMYEAIYDVDDGFDPRDENWDWDGVIGN